MESWPRNCVPHVIEAPSTLGLRARVSVDWNGQYILLLGQREDYLWDAPLLQCGPAVPHNPRLRAHLQKTVGLRYGLITSQATNFSNSSYFILLSCIVFAIFFEKC